MLLGENELDAHYLTSRNHPTCSKCNIGFATELEYAEVYAGHATSAPLKANVNVDVAQFTIALRIAV